MVCSETHATPSVSPFGVRAEATELIENNQVNQESHHYRILFALVPKKERKIYVIVLLRHSDTADCDMNEHERTHRTNGKLRANAKCSVLRCKRRDYRLAAFG